MQILQKGDSLAIYQKVAGTATPVHTPVKLQDSTPAFVLKSTNGQNPADPGYALLVQGSIDGIDYFDLLSIAVMPENRGVAYFVNQAARVNYVKCVPVLPAPEIGEALALTIIA